ncbi:glycoside hydrolase family 130 protein [candidate division KSB1 bacterium]|nr:glycoside hydrolase family 130 protein [candidate division KSB1 bacterium]
MSQLIIGNALPNIPWEERPGDVDKVVWRSKMNPVIRRNPIPCAGRIFNSCVLPYNGEYIGVFRADYHTVRPQLHFGRSKDGYNFQIEHEKIVWQNEAGQIVENGYAYDPRFVKIEDTYYVNWCDDFPGPSIGMGRTNDFKTWIKMENVTMPFNRNGVMFPRKINGMYAMLSRPSDSGHTPFGDIVLSYSPDLTFWGKHRLVMRRGGHGWWQDTKIGAGPVPIETTEGWLLFYHGVTTTCNGFVYSMGAALLDLDEPNKVIYRGLHYLLTPEEDYETNGFVPNVAFPCAAMYDAPTGRIAIYYGGADSYTCLAFCQVDEVMDYLKNNSEV